MIIQNGILLLIGIIFIYLAYDDAKYEHVSLLGLICFNLLACVYFFLLKPNIPIEILIYTVLLFILMGYFVYRNKMGLGDILASIGCFFIVHIHFFIMMSLSFLLCSIMMIMQKKTRTGFIPYMFLSSVTVLGVCSLC